VKDLLSPENQGVLTQFALANVLLAFDYDGTLAPIVRDRDHAPMRSSTQALFAAVCELYPCAIISGRARADVARYVNGSSVRYLMGNHGLEPNERMEDFERLASAMLRELSPLLAHLQGVELENKRYSLAVHYRRSWQWPSVRREIMRAIDLLGIPTRTISGKRVVNVLPKDAPHKGTALQELRTKCSVDAAIYVGDDMTDEDVFDLERTGSLLAVRVGRSKRSAAEFYLRSQGEIDVFLASLIRARKHEDIARSDAGAGEIH
jgi:trehalose 6-phosphate phosphatase